MSASPTNEHSFPAPWPACVPALRALARRLVVAGLADDEVVAALRDAFPGHDLTDGPAWRRDAPYMNIVASEHMAWIRERDGRRGR